LVVATVRLSRERLLGPLCRHGVTVVEAAGGYGKSLLAAQLERRLSVPTVTVALRERHADPVLFPGALRQGFQAARLSDLAASLEDRPEPLAVVGALLSALEEPDEAVLMVVDDAHFLRREGAEAMARLIAVWPGPHRCSCSVARARR
jgi:ATP/maltotriose-dependent transcriptional regulator MalT